MDVARHTSWRRFRSNLGQPRNPDRTSGEVCARGFRCDSNGVPVRAPDRHLQCVRVLMRTAAPGDARRGDWSAHGGGGAKATRWRDLRSDRQGHPPQAMYRRPREHLVRSTWMNSPSDLFHPERCGRLRTLDVQKSGPRKGRNRFLIRGLCGMFADLRERPLRRISTMTSRRPLFAPSPSELPMHFVHRSKLHLGVRLPVR